MGKYFEQMSDAVVQVRNALAGWETYEGTVPTNVRLQRALQSGWKGQDEAKKVVVIKELERMPEWLKKDGRRIEDFEDFTDGLPLNRRLRPLPFPEIRRMIQNYKREQTFARSRARTENEPHSRASSSLTPEEDAIETILKKLKLVIAKLSSGDTREQEKTARAFDYLRETIEKQIEYLNDIEEREMELELEKLVDWVEKNGRVHDDFARLLMGHQRDAQGRLIGFPQLDWMFRSQREDTEKPLPWLAPSSHSLGTQGHGSILSARQQIVYHESF